MKQQEEQKHVNLIDDFAYNQHVNLFTMIGGGHQHSQVFLQQLVDSIHHDKFCCQEYKFPSILLTGKEGSGKRTYAYSYLNSLCLDDIRYIDCSLFGPSPMAISYFSGNTDSGYIVYNIENLDVRCTQILQQVVRCRYFELFNYLQKEKTVFKVQGPVVLITSDLSRVNSSIVDSVSHILPVDVFIDQEQLKLVVLQRLHHSSIKVQDDNMLGDIIQYGHGHLPRIFSFLRDCCVIMKSAGRDTLQWDDVKMAGRLVE